MQCCRMPCASSEAGRRAQSRPAQGMHTARAGAVDGLTARVGGGDGRLPLVVDGSSRRLSVCCSSSRWLCCGTATLLAAAARCGSLAADCASLALFLTAACYKHTI